MNQRDMAVMRASALLEGLPKELASIDNVYRRYYIKAWDRKAAYSWGTSQMLITLIGIISSSVIALGFLIADFPYNICITVFCSFIIFQYLITTTVRVVYYNYKL